MGEVLNGEVVGGEIQDFIEPQQHVLQHRRQLRQTRVSEDSSKADWCTLGTIHISKGKRGAKGAIARKS